MEVRTPILCYRKAAPCPNCQTELLITKLPFRIMHIASALYFIYFIAQFKLGYEGMRDHLWILFPLMIVAAILTLAGLFKIRYVLADPKDLYGQ